jgi:acylpyruvate hydrolase
MKLITFLSAGRERLGALSGDDVVDVNLAATALHAANGAADPVAAAQALTPPDLLAVLQAGGDALAAVRAAVDHAATLTGSEAAAVTTRLADVTLLPPVPRPPKIICVARNFAEHAKEAGLQISEIPILFARFAETLVPHGGDVIRPTVSEQVDWEGELAVVIGKRGRHISREDAMDHVVGYSIFNDVSVRDYQFRVTQYTGGKNFQGSGPFGPALVLKDEVADPHALDIVTEVNDQEMQRGNTKDMIFDIPAIIEHVSEFVSLEPGDVIPMGTPAGVGFKREPPIFLRPGDTVRVTIPGIGVLENPVVAEEDLA